MIHGKSGAHGKAGIARGGLLVAGAVGYALGVKNTFTMNVEFYTGVDERLDMPMLLPPAGNRTSALLASIGGYRAVNTTPPRAPSAEKPTFRA